MKFGSISFICAATFAIAMSAPAAARSSGATHGARVEITVVLPYRHDAELRALLAAQRDRKSPLYRHYVTAQQFRNYFSPAPEAYARAAFALRRAGFSIETFANRTAIRAVAPSFVAERYFNTTLAPGVTAAGRSTYLNVRPAVVPKELGAARVAGLNGVATAPVASSERVPRAPHSLIASPLFGPDGGFGPAGIAKAEDFPLEHGYTGAGSNVADLIDGAVTDSDVSTFLKTFGTPRSGPRTTAFRIDGGCGANCSDSFQATIDAEWALAMAPGASLFTYQIPYLGSAYIVDAFNRIASDDAVNVVNVSFGFCELSFGDAALAIEPVVAQGAAEGIAFESVAFGGAGTCGVPDLPLPVSPADLDTVTAIGGSNSFVDRHGKEIVQTGYFGSNGGVSRLISLPPWQAATPGTDNAGRNVPDLVVPVEVDGAGPSIYFGGSWVGGYVFVNNAPFAGYLASLQQMYGYALPLGNIAPDLYATLQTFGYSGKGKKYFDDVTLGCDGTLGTTPVCATPGYDLTTGIGSLAGGYNVAKAFALGPIQSPSP